MMLMEFVSGMNISITERWELITSKLSKGLLLVKATTVDGNQETFKLSN